MTKRMLIDATHAEETRVVVLDGNRLEDFDVETSTKKQLKGNIYLAKVVRVEPSLQAAFVEYGGGRHGFLAFGEIHPDYYQIPVADRQRLLALQAEEAREEAEAEDAAAAADAKAGHHRPRQAASAPDVDEPVPDEPVPDEPARDEPTNFEPTNDEPGRHALTPEEQATEQPMPRQSVVDDTASFDLSPEFGEAPVPGEAAAPAVADAPASVLADRATEPQHAVADRRAAADTGSDPAAAPAHRGEATGTEPTGADDEPEASRPAQPALIPRDERYGAAEADVMPAVTTPADGDDDEFGGPEGDAVPPEPPPETIGGDTEQSDAAEEARARRTSRFLRNYRIQEVIKRRQILLVQVVKEERGTKGAALTTYISLAGRFCVLMPNSPRGGGISRKITSAADRRRLKEITAELDIPPGMGLIVRTAGANRPKPEIKRDCEYLMRLWDDIRDHTMHSIAPALIYEEASLIKRAIRDVYSRDIDEVVVDGAEGWKAAHDFMRMLMPSHAKKVILWQGAGQPLFAKHQVEAQLDAMLAPSVQLKSGGYLVINQTEALVAIDVNSGRATRERGIEETALRTNLEAADEVARQLRLRDLAGLIVIDFIDMEAKKHNGMVEKRLKDALKIDRARIQVGHISHFGLMEMSRQRLRPSLAETSFVTCPHCRGIGLVRSTESSAIHVLRAIEDEGAKGRAALIMVHVASAIALYLLNNKRDRLAEIEARYAMRVHFTPDDTLVVPETRIDRLRPQLPEHERPQLAAPMTPAAPAVTDIEEDEEEADDVFEVEDEAPPAAPASPLAAARAEPRPSGDEGVRRRRRRRRRGARRDPTGVEIAGGPGAPGQGDETGDDGAEDAEVAAPGEAVAEAANLDAAAESRFAEPGLAEAEADAADLAAEAEPGVDPAGTDQPSLDAADLDENGLPRPRRRGRRGGRRRRRDENELEAPAEPPAVPVYTGPTPADPFGGGPFDIFDMIDQEDEPPPATLAALPQPVPGPASDAPRSVAAVAEATVAGAATAVLVGEASEPEPLPAMAPDAVAVAPPATVAEPPPEPAIAAEPPPTPAALPEAPPTLVAVPASPPEPIAGPPIKPLVIGQDEIPVEPKRGWWKR